jgi:hypothetical protein
VLAVDEGEPADGRVAGEVGPLDVELVVRRGVEVPAGRRGAGAAGRRFLAQHGVLRERDRIRRLPGPERAERPVDVHARDDEQALDFDRAQHGLAVGPACGGEVHQGIGTEAVELVSASRQLEAMDVQMRRPRQIRRLVLTSVDHEDVVPVAEQLVDERPADEPGAAYDRHSHRRRAAVAGDMRPHPRPAPERPRARR